MKRIFLFFSVMGFLSSCSNNDDDIICSGESTLIGTWELVETLIDPGGGNTDFVTVISEKIVQFNTDGSITSNGNLCNVSILSDTPSAGTYSITESIISPFDCINTEWNIRFELNDSSLIISYRCFEPCEEKYLKVK